jgi:ethanolamine utilization cobalamin adenosyltransferase
MNNLVEDFKRYLRETPREKVLSDLEEIKAKARRGPRLKDLLEDAKIKLKWKNEDFFVIDENNNNLVSPKYSSGSLFLNP